MKKPARVRQFEDFARSVVGDGKAPNIFFVGIGGNVVLITSDFELAYEAWRSAAGLARGTNVSVVLEDRQTGTLADYDLHEFEIDGKMVQKWDVVDDARRFIKR
jgi:hypothetical protein